MIMSIDIIDIAKIAVTVASVVFLYLFRKSITRSIGDLLTVSGSKYRGKETDQILNEINNKLEIIMKR